MSTALMRIKAALAAARNRLNAMSAAKKITVFTLLAAFGAGFAKAFLWDWSISVAKQAVTMIPWRELWHTLGWLGIWVAFIAAVLGVWFGVLVTIDYMKGWGAASSAPVPNVAEMAALQRRLEEATVQAARSEEELQGYATAIRYGPRALGPAELPPLNAIQHKFLHEHMMELRNVTISAGMAHQKLMLAVLWMMWEERPEGVRHCLATFVNEQRLEPCKRSLQRFQDEVDFGRDSRESFARFYQWYAENREFTANLSTMIGHQIDRTAGYELWVETDRQLEVAIKQKLDVPQFSAIKKWLKVSALPRPES